MVCELYLNAGVPCFIAFALLHLADVAGLWVCVYLFIYLLVFFFFLMGV